MQGKVDWRKLTADEWDEAVLRARAAARGGFSVHSNPYDRDKRPEMWTVWRRTFVDCFDDDGALAIGAGDA